MTLFEHSNYRKLIKGQIKAFAERNPRTSLKRISQRAGMQYTYVSRALSKNARVHLSEDALFGICKQLGMYPDEIEYVFALRSLSLSEDPQRRAYLQQKIDRLRREQGLNAPLQNFRGDMLKQEIDYLLDPTCLLVAIAFCIESYRKDPDLLRAHLGLSRASLDEVLGKLCAAGFIAIDSMALPSERVKLLRSHFHFGTDHPLMRAHQALLREQCAARLSRTSEKDKQSLMATFSCDAETFEMLKSELKAAIQRAEKIVTGAKSEVVCQMNLDLFKWF